MAPVPNIKSAKLIVSNCFIAIMVMWLLPKSILAQRGQSYPQNYVGITAGLASAPFLPGEIRTEDRPATLVPTKYNDLKLSTGGLLGLRIGRTTTAPRRFCALEIEGFILDGSNIKQSDEKRYWMHGDGTPVFPEAYITMQALFLNIIINPIDSHPKPYIGFGIGGVWTDLDLRLQKWPGYDWILEPSGKLLGSNTYKLRQKTISYGMQAFLGWEYKWTESLSCDLGYRYFETRWEVPEAVIEFDTKMRYKTHLLTVSVKRRY